MPGKQLHRSIQGHSIHCCLTAKSLHIQDPHQPLLLHDAGGGCPNHFNACTTCKNALRYWRRGNHPSIKSKIDQVMFTINKEGWNNYIIHVPHWLWRFIPHCFITPQHILEKPEKKDRQIFDDSRKYNWDSIPVNAMTFTRWAPN